MTEKTYTMISYETGRTVGAGSSDLARASIGANGENGVVSATRDAAGILILVPASRVSDMERMGRQVFAVYLDPAISSLEVDEARPLNRIGEPSSEAEIMADAEAARVELERLRSGGLP